MADNRQFTDHNEIGGVNVYLEDKKLSEKTSQSSVASTDFVLLEDTDGAYHKIAKASFVEAIREALGSIINSVAKGTDIAKLPVLDSNNDLGMGTLDNLALNIGAIIPGSSLKSSANTIKTTSAYFVYGDNTKDTPDDYGVLLTIKSYNNTEYGPSLAQLFISYHETLYFRSSIAGTYNPWKQVSTI